MSSLETTKKKDYKISKHLQDLIDAANNTMITLKSQIVEIYETAKKEGFTPVEARALIQVKIVNVTDRYIRKILPDEAKNVKHSNKPKGDDEDTDFDDDDDDENGETEYTSADGEPEQVPVADRKPFKLPEIDQPIKDAELVDNSIPLATEDPSEIGYDPDPGTSIEPIGSEITEDQKYNQAKQNLEKLQKYIKQLEEEIAKLKIERVGSIGNKFEFEYDFELPSGQIVPFIVTALPDKKTGWIRLNKPKAEQMQKEEEKRKKK